MKLLGLDSSAVSASCAITENGRILAQAAVNTKITYSQTLMPLVESVAKAAGIALSEIDAFAVSNGPGSFTGLRISVSAVKGLAFALDKPVSGVSTLLSLAHNLTGQNVIACPVMDARRGEVYNALFEVNGETVTRLTPDRAISLDDLSKELQQFADRKIILVGDGAELANCQLSIVHCPLSIVNCSLSVAGEIIRWQNAASVCFAAEKFTTAKELMPVYIRKPQAEREREK